MREWQLIINEEVNKVQRIALEKRIAGEDYTATTLMENKKQLFPKTTVGESYLCYIQELKTLVSTKKVDTSDHIIFNIGISVILFLIAF